MYLNISKAIRRVPHGNGLPVPEPPDNFAVRSDDDDHVSSNSEEQQPSASRDADYLPSTDSCNHKITEGELNDLIRDLEFSNNKAESLIITQPTNALIVCHLLLNHFFKTLSLLLHVSIAYRLSSSGSTYSS